MVFQLLKARFLYVLIVAVCADAVRAYSSASDKYDAKSSNYPWGGGVVSSQFRNHHGVPSNGHLPAGNGIDANDLLMRDEAGFFGYNLRSPNLKKGGKSAPSKQVVVKPLPNGPQFRDLSSSSYTEDGRHFTKPKKLGISQSHDLFLDVARPVEAAGTYREPSASGRPAVSRPAPSSWMPGRRKPGVASSHVGERVPGFVQSSVRYPGLIAASGSVGKPPLRYESADRDDSPSSGSGITDVTPFPQHSPDLHQPTSYGSADRAGPLVGPYGLLQGGLLPSAYAVQGGGWPSWGHLSRFYHRGFNQGRYGMPYSGFYPESYGWIPGHQIPVFQPYTYEVPFYAGYTSPYGSGQNGYLSPRPYDAGSSGFLSVPFDFDDTHNGGTGSYDGLMFPTHYPHGHRDLVQSNGILNRGRLGYLHTSYPPLAARPVPSSTAMGYRRTPSGGSWRPLTHRLVPGRRNGFSSGIKQN